jgi:peptide-methionine (S)-S-oxide reductase
MRRLGILLLLALPAGAGNTAQTAVFAGGCFWGVEDVFEHLKGVVSAVSGYTGGDKSTATYKAVSSGKTGHAEAVRVAYDASRISYAQLLEVFFMVAHDPMQVDGQGPDLGSQYRSTVFYSNDDQKIVAEAYIQRLTAAKIFPRPIATPVRPLTTFYPAEEYHQHFAERNPNLAYVVTYDLPKLKRLQHLFPELWK